MIMQEIVGAAATGGKHNAHDVTVHVKHLGEHEKENFKVPPAWTLQQIWDQAYLELKVAKQDRDLFQAPQKKDNPVDLTPHLSLTLAAAQTAGLCDVEFEIAAGTGGA